MTFIIKPSTRDNWLEVYKRRYAHVLTYEVSGANTAILGLAAAVVVVGLNILNRSPNCYRTHSVTTRLEYKWMIFRLWRSGSFKVVRTSRSYAYWLIDWLIPFLWSDVKMWRVVGYLVSENVHVTILTNLQIVKKANSTSGGALIIIDVVDLW